MRVKSRVILGLLVTIFTTEALITTETTEIFLNFFSVRSVVISNFSGFFATIHCNAVVFRGDSP